MALEIERKFLVPDGVVPPPAEATELIEQGYIAVTEDGTEVRLRHIADQHVLGVKRGKGGLVRIEVECPLTEAEFEELWPSTAGARLVKTRYSVRLGELVASLDVYAQELHGLRTVEVEFTSEETGVAFTPPEWFGPEITGAKEYKNRRLAVDGLPAGIRPAEPGTASGSR